MFCVAEAFAEGGRHMQGGTGSGGARKARDPQRLQPRKIFRRFRDDNINSRVTNHVTDALLYVW
jgi:L-rhamnose isomerase